MLHLVDPARARLPSLRRMLPSLVITIVIEAASPQPRLNSAHVVSWSCLCPRRNYRRFIQAKGSWTRRRSSSPPRAQIPRGHRSSVAAAGSGVSWHRGSRIGTTRAHVVTCHRQSPAPASDDSLLKQQQQQQQQPPARPEERADALPPGAMTAWQQQARADAAGTAEPLRQPRPVRAQQGLSAPGPSQTPPPEVSRRQ